MHTCAGRFGALSGFGLSIVKWVAIVKRNNWTGGLTEEDSWIWWLLITFGVLISCSGSLQYVRIKYMWARMRGGYSFWTPLFAVALALYRTHCNNVLQVLRDVYYCLNFFFCSLFRYCAPICLWLSVIFGNWTLWSSLCTDLLVCMLKMFLTWSSNLQTSLLPWL